MTHKITRVECEEWEEEICDNCGHPVSMHYDKPYPVMSITNIPMYVAEGCMSLSGTRKIEGNPYLRCNCLHSV